MPSPPFFPIIRSRGIYSSSHTTVSHHRTSSSDNGAGETITVVVVFRRYVFTVSKTNSNDDEMRLPDAAGDGGGVLRRRGVLLLMSPQKVAEGKDEDEWRALIDALRMYKAAYGDLKVPSRFIVPGMPPWPDAAHNLKLGQRVAQIRSTGKFIKSSPTRRKTLDDMGFIWRLRAPTRDKNMDGITLDQIVNALTTYKTVVDADLRAIPTPFVVPDCDPWPMECRGLPLGRMLSTVTGKKYLNANSGARERLGALGLELERANLPANDARYKKVLNALKRYKEVHGDLLVPQPFVIPGDDPERWPEEELWGLRLGARVNAIRSQGTFVKTNPGRREELTELGFV
eukprot:CAMPEP_0172499810 /NCGR_PEP_ID=MMETSP1066-20121228/131256_1 /TAXON_ID=671091 /ORGANISM="Coscinodiscus wailesii, Strain CCMP2513" /LENGTH=342 /DNA_ID=CAMNT_0013273743 /DNA_START=363 /DNA_END=1389 /DNA_ORIENTATION=-